MKTTFYEDGTLSLSVGEKALVPRSPVAMAVRDGVMYAPQSAEIGEGFISLSYGEFSAVLSKKIRSDGSVRLEVTDIPDEIDGFVFGPYAVPEAVNFGENVGAAWLSDGSAVCIQGLNTKTVGETPFKYRNDTAVPSPAPTAAGRSGSTIVLNCFAENMTRPKVTSIPGIPNFVANTVPAPAGLIVGAAVILTYGSCADELLDRIGEIELEEGLPHPTINGEWAKKSKHANDIYLIFENDDFDEQMKIAERAGVRDIYFGSPFESWGHFGVNKGKYPGGMDEFCALTAKAAEKNVHVGFHTLTNFITTNDSYITPIPHEKLLYCDETPILTAVSDADAELIIGEARNYANKTTLNAAQIGDEIIQYSAYDAEKKALVGVKRGCFGTKACAHEAGETVKRLIDHGYATLFPDIDLQHEMAKTIGSFVKAAHMGRISFDGVEGCQYTGRGEYATAEFVKDVYDISGSELLSDASYCSHYRWHAHAYFNNGEPWYDTDRRGGMYNFRALRQARYKANLIPGMLGWYVIWDSSDIFEPTLPETMESILARTIGFDAGLAFQINAKYGEKVERCCDMIKLWQEFRHSGAVVPEDVLERMRRKFSDWHLEKDADGRFILSELECEQSNLLRVDRKVYTETGIAGYGTTQQSDNEAHHRSMIMTDRGSSEGYPDLVEPFRMRIRIGTPRDKGEFQNLAFCGGWFGETPFLSFTFCAQAGEYLEYTGGTELRRYDADYNLIETIEGVGRELTYNSNGYGSYTLDYDLTGDIIPTLTTIHSKVKYTF